MPVIGRPGFIAPVLLTASLDANNSLEGIRTSGLTEGSSCYVQDNNGLYALFPSDVQVPDNSTIVAALDGGNWILQATLSPVPGAGNWALLPQVLYVFGDSAAATETGSPSEPYKTLQAAIDATSADTPTEIYVVPQSSGTEGNITVPSDRDITFTALGPPLECVLGTVGVTLDTTQSKLRFVGFDIQGAVTVAEGGTPPPTTSNLTFRNCRGVSLDATSTSGTSLYVFVSWEGALTGTKEYQWSGAITGPDSTSSSWQFYGTGNNEANIPRFTGAISGFGVVMLQDVVLNNNITSINTQLRRVTTVSVTVDGVGAGSISADGESWRGIAVLNNVPVANRTDSNYGLIGSSAGRKNVIYVDGQARAGAGGPESPFPTVQEAIDATDSGAPYEIVVAPGTYNEDPSVPADRRLRIRGTGSEQDQTVIGTTGANWAWVATGARTANQLTLENMTWGQSPGPCEINITGTGACDLFVDRASPGQPSGGIDAGAMTGPSEEVFFKIQNNRKISTSEGGMTITGNLTIDMRILAEQAEIANVVQASRVEFRDCLLLVGSDINMRDSGPIELIDCTGDVNVSFPTTGSVQVDGVSNFSIKNGGSITNGVKVIIDDVTP